MLAPLCRQLDKLSKMGPSVRPVRTDGLHITLRFLNEVDSAHIDALAGAMDVAVAEGQQGGWLVPFDLHLTHVGTFPQDRNAPPRIVFAAPDEPGPLPQLSDLIDARLDALNLPIPPRDKPMHPHITLARVKRRRRPDRRVMEGITHLIAEAKKTGLGSARIKAVKLIESRLGAQGPDYSARHVCRL